MSDDQPTHLPAAKIEDGKPFPPQADIVPEPVQYRPKSSGLGWVIFIMLGFAFLVLGLLVCAGRGLGGMTSGLGRPLRTRGRVRLASYRRGNGFHDSTRPRTDRIGAWRRFRRGMQWLAAARAEHASVPAFEQLATRLETLGAPASLVARCHAAAHDEVRHARRCYALARTYSGVALTAGAAPQPSEHDGDLRSIAIESVVDGCIGEAIAADLAHEAASHTDDPVLAETFTMFAQDEARHAELAWDILAFCVTSDPSLRDAAIAAASRAPHANGPYELPRTVMRAIVRRRHASVQARLLA